MQFAEKVELSGDICVVGSKLTFRQSQCVLDDVGVFRVFPSPVKLGGLLVERTDVVTLLRFRID